MIYLYLCSELVYVKRQGSSILLAAELITGSLSICSKVLWISVSKVCDSYGIGTDRSGLHFWVYRGDQVHLADMFDGKWLQQKIGRNGEKEENK